MLYLNKHTELEAPVFQYGKWDLKVIHIDYIQSTFLFNVCNVHVNKSQCRVGGEQFSESKIQLVPTQSWLQQPSLPLQSGSVASQASYADR